jgi:hypothetical protein
MIRSARRLATLAAVLLAAAPAARAADATPGLPQGAPPASPGQAGRTFTPSQLVAVSSPTRFLITSSANERGAFLWVIDSVDHNVTLCEKAAAASDFTCSKKVLP